MPVLLSVPHAGRNYPAEIFANLRIARSEIVRLEDRYADLLARAAVTLGYPVVVAHTARAWIDLNRDENDVDVGMVAGLQVAGRPSPSPKQRGGLGLIPRRLSGVGEIWKRPISAADLTHRIESYHRPYHQHISVILEKMRAQFGVAILLDLHSMPTVPDAQFVVGDRFGRSSANQYTEILTARLCSHGFDVALNHPYSGDYILRRHGAADADIHAIQLEIDRNLYLDPQLREPGDGVKRIATLVAELVQTLAADATRQHILQAAE